MDQNKLAPERAVLGALILEPERLAEVSGLLRIRSFEDPRHQRIYAAISHLYRAGKNPDLILLTDFLDKENSLEGVGGVAYLTDLATMFRGTGQRARYYAMIVAEGWMKREQERLARETIQRVKENDDPFEIAYDTSESIFRILSVSTDREPRPISVGLDEHVDAIFSREVIGGIPCGIAELDRLTGGFHDAELSIVAARPSLGKTALMTRFALTTAEADIATLIFSAEMSGSQLQDRFLSALGHVDVHRIRNRSITEADEPRIRDAASKLSRLPIIVDDSPGMKIGHILAKARALALREKVKIIFVDYLQLVHGTRHKNSTREQEVGMISQSLKALAKELNIPVVALAQLHRGVESRRDRRPQLSDLRESGSIEQDADNVLMIHRPERYGIEYLKDGEHTQGKAWLLIEKQRSGPIGEVRVAFVKQYADFQSYSPSQHYEARYEVDYTDSPF